MVDRFLPPDVMAALSRLSASLEQWSRDQVDLQRHFDTSREPSVARYGESSRAAAQVAADAGHLAYVARTYIASVVPSPRPERKAPTTRPFQPSGRPSPTSCRVCGLRVRSFADLAAHEQLTGHHN